MKNRWIERQIQDRSHPLPLLFYPAAPLLGITIKELLFSAINQALAMKIISDKCPLSAAIGIIDASVEAEAFGAKMQFYENQLPIVQENINLEEIENLNIPKVGVGREGINIMAIKKAKALIKDRPIFSVVTGPYTVCKELLSEAEITVAGYEKPQLIDILLKKISLYLIEYIKKLKKAGAEGIIINEPAAGGLTLDLCDKFSSRYLREICHEISDDNLIIMYHNCGNVILLVESIISINADIYHFGSGVDIGEMLKLIPQDKIVMGNIDASEFKKEPSESIVHSTQKLLSRCKHNKNYVISSGCIIPADAAWENIMSFFTAVEGFYLNNK